MKVSRRCLKNILESAMTIVKKFDKDRYQKPNFDYISKNPGEVCIHDCPSDKSEAHLIASIIMNDISSHKGKKRNAFVLIPTTKYAKEIQTSLRKFRLNYDFRKGRDFSNWNNLFLLENWVKNPNDNLLTREIIQLIIESGSSKIPTNKSKSESRIQERQKYLNEIAKIWTTTFQKNTSFWLELKKQKSNLVLKEIIDMMENLIIKSSGNKLSEYLKLISESIRPWTSKFIFFEELENLLKFSTNQSHLKTKYNIRILSMQAAKGLEAELIFVVGLEEKSIPFCTSDDKNISEKARTLFVAMTRAKEQLHLLHCRNRAGSSTFYQDSRQLQVSHFLDVLPKEFIKKIYHQSQ